MAALIVATLTVGRAVAAGIIELPHKPVAPPLALTDVDGQRHRLSDYAGKVVVVNFWAAWCGPCREELPSLDELSQRTASGEVAVLAVNAGDDRSHVRRFLADSPVDFPVLLDPDSASMGRWQVQALPSTYVVTPDGRIYGGHVGAMDWSTPEVIHQLRAVDRRHTAGGAGS